MAPTRRRKGKQSGGGSRSSTPTPSTGENEKKDDANDMKNKNDNATTISTMTKLQENDETLDEDSLLVLTSEKRRGVYECDYCHSDISQQPRIRCAVCDDFDLCLDCFATTDHAAMMARIKAANQTQTELNKDGIHSTSIVGVAISSAAAHHEDHHCYRVCDSTRYPLFPVGRVAVPAADANKKGDNNDNNKEKVTETEEIETEKLNGKEEEENSDNDKMCVDGEEEDKDKKTPPAVTTNTTDAPSTTDTTSSTSNNISVEIALCEDAKIAWTIEEDLRLIDAIQTHGLGNWVDISEAIGGEGSVGKTPKRCMERYLDDFLGRYGHILPPWTIVDDNTCTENNLAAADIDSSHSGTNNSNVDVDAMSTKSRTTNSSDDIDITTSNNDNDMEENNKMNETENDKPSSQQQNENEKDGQPVVAAAAAAEKEDTGKHMVSMTTPLAKTLIDDDEGLRTSKRRNAGACMSGAGGGSVAGGTRSSRKKLCVVPTESLPGYHNIWPRPYLPAISGAGVGKEVARDLSCKAELAFVKSTLAASSKEEADKIRQEWMDTKIGHIGSPTVLPPRPEDAAHLVGSELAGFMPRRGDFDVEWENEAESPLADMEFIRSDTPEDKKLKLEVLQIYCQKLDEREKRKTFVLNRHLYDYRKYVQDDRKLPVDERDLVHRMRLFERFHTPDEHKRFITDILKAKRLRKEIAKLQMYRRIGIRTLAEAEMYELDKDRRQFHKLAQLQKERDAKMKAAASGPAGGSGTTKGIGATSNATFAGATSSQMNVTNSLWKQYRTNDRKNRRSSSRSEGLIQASTKTLDDVVVSKRDEIIPSIEGKKIPKDDSNEVMEKTDNNEMTMKERLVENKAILTEKSGDSNDQSDAMEIDVQEEFDISSARCRELLSRKELALCERLHIYPVQYLDIKKALIHESLVSGLLDKDSSNSGRRTIVKIDVERRGNIVDFLVRAGWITHKIADGAMRVVTPQPIS